MKSVVLIEDHVLTRAGLRTALDASGDLRVVAEADDGMTGLQAIAEHQPDVAVIDIGLPGIDGIELTRRARIAAPGTHIAILTMHDLESEIYAALAAGADAYSLKTSPADESSPPSGLLPKAARISIRKSRTSSWRISGRLARRGLEHRL